VCLLHVAHIYAPLNINWKVFYHVFIWIKHTWLSGFYPPPADLVDSHSANSGAPHNERSRAPYAFVQADGTGVRGLRSSNAPGAGRNASLLPLSGPAVEPDIGCLETLPPRLKNYVAKGVLGVIGAGLGGGSYAQ
jgi:hypothetical protein